jgi:radical SAM protein (TIGR01212 family)
VQKHLLRDTSSDGFIAYFQNFTNTYAPVDVLKARYDSALISDRIKVLAIGTRPDCITEEIADLLVSYTDRVDVWVELGLQSASDSVALAINRGYRTEVFLEAARILRSHGIPFVVHMIIGLPTEEESDVDKTVDLINASGAWGAKIHSIYVMEGTRLAQMYRSGEYTPPERDYYVKMCSRSIARLSPEIIVHRITGDCPGGLLVAPSWNSDKNLLINLIRRELEENGMRQGDLYSK